MLTHHSPMPPKSPPRSSITNRRHVPLGLVPAKPANDEPYGPAGAGSNMTSASLAFGLGLYVPDGMSAPIVGGCTPPAAASSNVSVALARSEVPPTSDMSMTVTPVGPTSYMWMSAAKVCDMRTFAVTVKSPDPMPDTSTADGYCSAGPTLVGLAGTLKGDELQKLFVCVGSDTLRSGRTSRTVGA